MYSGATLFEKDYEFDIERIITTKVVFHYIRKPIKECIEIQYGNLESQIPRICN